MLPLLALSGLFAPAVATPTPAGQFVGHAARICLVTRADPAAVRQMAQKERWTSVDPASLPGYPPQYIAGGRVFTRTHAWKLERGGTAYWVGLFDLADEPTVRDCSFMGWDLDFEAVNAVFLGKNPPPKGAKPEIPIRMYKFPDATLIYGWSGIGERRLHVVSVTPKP